MLVKGLHEAGWMVEKPKASMYIWAKIPEPTRRWARSSSPSSCCATPRSRSSPGIGFGDYGDDHVRFALIENESRTRQAVRGIKDMFRKDGPHERGPSHGRQGAIVRAAMLLPAPKPCTASCAPHLPADYAAA